MRAPSGAITWRNHILDANDRAALGDAERLGRCLKRLCGEWADVGCKEPFPQLSDENLIGDTPWLAIPGAFLFNMTTAVTLVSIPLLFPGRPGFGFGHPCLALFLGAIPRAPATRPMLDESWSILVVVLFSGATLFGGLKGVEILRSGRAGVTAHRPIGEAGVHPEAGA